MKICDVIIIAGPGVTVKEIRWLNDSLKSMFSVIWDRYVGSSLTGIFHDCDFAEDFGEVSWEGNVFDYSSYERPGGDRIIIMKEETDREYLISQALDLVPEGIQIYDKNACAVHFNKRSREISRIPNSMDIEGRYLLDMYNLDESISTTMTSLRTGEPVINRVDHYNSSDGTFIATANSAFPVTKNGVIVGSVVFEQDKKIVSSYISRMEGIEKALNSYSTSDSPVTFTGYTFDDVIGSGPMQDALDLAKKIAPQDCSVLLIGDTGTGKELFAQSIHKASTRRSKKFIAINCAAIPSTLIESLLFGTSKGSFTGSEDKAGYFEEADGGTLFLDELNSMGLSMQSKILRVLQENTLRRVGGKKDIRVDVRIISSCNENPFKAIADNRLRKDLFYRISTVMIDLPLLRDHIEDLDVLIKARLRESNTHFVNKVEGATPEVMDFLRSYSWPGNVRELYHVIDYAMNVTDSDKIEMQHLPKYLFGEGSGTRSGLRAAYGDQGGKTAEEQPAAVKATAEKYLPQSLQTSMDAYEEQVLRNALDHFGGNVTKTADALDIKRQSLQYRIKKYGIII